MQRSGTATATVIRAIALSGGLELLLRPDVVSRPPAR